MLLHTYTTVHDCARRSLPKGDDFYKEAMADAVRMRSAQFIERAEKLVEPTKHLQPIGF